MQPQYRHLILSFVLLALIFPMSALADSTPEAKQWIEKFIEVYERGPFTTQYSANIDITQGDQAVSGTMDGKLIYFDTTHMRMVLNMVLNGMPGGDSDEKTNMEMLTVTDGTNTWTEVNMPAVGMQQIMKLSLVDAEKLAAADGMGGSNPAGMDPVQQLRTMAEVLDFKLVSVNDGEVHLQADIAEEAKANLGQMSAMPGLETLSLILDEKTGFPRRFSMGNEQPMISLEFKGLEFLKESEISMDDFVYTPPEGGQVLDLGAMMGAQAEAATQ